MIDEAFVGSAIRDSVAVGGLTRSGSSSGRVKATHDATMHLPWRRIASRATGGAAAIVGGGIALALTTSMARLYKEYR